MIWCPGLVLEVKPAVVSGSMDSINNSRLLLLHALRRLNQPNPSFANCSIRGFNAVLCFPNPWDRLPGKAGRDVVHQNAANAVGIRHMVWPLSMVSFLANFVIFIFVLLMQHSFHASDGTDCVEEGIAFGEEGEFDGGAAASCRRVEHFRW